MQLKKGSKLFVRIDKVGVKNMTQQDFQDHIDYLENIAKDRFFLGGGLLNINGGMILCEAESFEEAQKVFHNDPIIERELYQCEIYEWELVILSKGDT